jgi:hypothetical protein
MQTAPIAPALIELYGAVVLDVRPAARRGDHLAAAGRHGVVLVPLGVAELADLPPFLGELDDGLARDLDAGVVAGAEPERGVLGVRVVAGRGSVAALLDGGLVEDLGLSAVPRGRRRCPCRWRRPPAARRPVGNAVDEGRRLAVAPLPVHALVVDQELRAHLDLRLVLHAVELLQAHGQEGDLVGALHLRVQGALEVLLELRVVLRHVRVDEGQEDQLVAVVDVLVPAGGLGAVQVLHALGDRVVDPFLIDALSVGRRRDRQGERQRADDSKH